LASLNRAQDRLSLRACLELVGSTRAIAVDRPLDDLEAELLQVAECVPDRVVLDRRGHDSVARALPAHAAPLMARLFASVPPDVKTISRPWR
jgi:hypothetical protein